MEEMASLSADEEGNETDIIIKQEVVEELETEDNNPIPKTVLEV